MCEENNGMCAALTAGSAHSAAKVDPFLNFGLYTVLFAQCSEKTLWHRHTPFEIMGQRAVEHLKGP